MPINKVGKENLNQAWAFHETLKININNMKNLIASITNAKNYCSDCLKKIIAVRYRAPVASSLHNEIAGLL